MRYAGQAYELTVPWTADPREAIHRLHEQRYGYADAGGRWSWSPSGCVPSAPDGDRVADGGSGRAASPAARRARVVRGAWIDTPVFDQVELRCGHAGPGPAIVAGPEATTVVPPGWRLDVDEIGSLVLSR